MAVRGIYYSHSSIAGDRIGDFNSRILQNQWGGMSPMTALSAGMPRESVNNTSWSWVEDDYTTTNAKATATALANATTIVVDNSNIWIPGSILLNHATGEQMYVSGISGNTITVVRGFANTTPTAVAINNVFQQVGTAFTEGSRGAAAVMTQGSTRVSYVQLFKASWSVTGTTQAIGFHTGSKEVESKGQAMERITNQMEEAALLSRPSVSRVTTVDGVQELRTTSGLDYSLRNNGGLVVVPAANSVAGRLNLTILNDFTRKIFDRNIKGQPNERLAYCSSSFLALIQQMVMDIKGYQYQVEATSFGIKVNNLVTPFGTLTFITHPLYLMNAALAGEVHVFHPGGVKRRYLRDIQVTPRSIANQTDARDASSGDILVEMGFEFKGAPCGGILSGAATAGGLAALPTS